MRFAVHASTGVNSSCVAPNMEKVKHFIVVLQTALLLRGLRSGGTERIFQRSVVETIIQFQCGYRKRHCFSEDSEAVAQRVWFNGFEERASERFRLLGHGDSGAVVFGVA